MKKCKICKKSGSYSKEFGIVLCPKHYYHYKKYGKIVNTKYDKNEINIIDDYILIKCADSKHNHSGNIIIDKDDYDKVKDIKWRLDKKGYGVNNSNKNIYIHNIIMQPQKDEIVDHIDGNPSNNRKNNLRIVSYYENCLNHKVKSTSYTNVTGISKGRRKKWRARICFNKREIFIGEYDNFTEAVVNRLIYEAILFQHHSRNYNRKTKTFDLSFVDKDTGEHFHIEMPDFKEENSIFLQIEETTYEELLKIESERGLGCLGSSLK